MTEVEITNLIEECKGLYSAHKSMYEDSKIISEWIKTLAKYDKNDIYSSLERHRDGNYSTRPIVLMDLIRSVPTLIEKETKKLGNIKVYCKICGRLLPYKEHLIHEDKCMSVDYIIREYKKWWKKDITASYLWSLPDYEFQEKYDALVKYIKNNTQNAEERDIINNYLGVDEDAN